MAKKAALSSYRTPLAEAPCRRNSVRRTLRMDELRLRTCLSTNFVISRRPTGRYDAIERQRPPIGGRSVQRLNDVDVSQTLFGGWLGLSVCKNAF